MKASAIRRAAFLLLLPLAGCGSTFSGASGPSAYAAMSCSDLNVALGSSSIGVSREAISRGRISNTNIPFWVPGGHKAIEALKNRQTRKIDTLQAETAAIAAERDRRCR